MTAAEIIAALAKRHPAPVWAFLEQVRSGTGFTKEPRTADAIAMSCWPSRGLELHGFEVKVHRGDWIREVRDPKKAEEIMAFCDRWWIVTPKDVVQEGEIPPTWGHMVVDGRGATAKIAAPKLEAQPVDRLFLAAILRKTNEVCIPAGSIKDKLKAEFDRGRDEGASGTKYELGDLRLLAKHVEEFEKASGVSIRYAWDKYGRIGEAVRQVLGEGPLKARKEMEQHRAWLAAQLRTAEEYLQDTAPDGTDAQVDNPSTVVPD